MTAPTASVELHWIPLGAGNRVVIASGKVFEAISAARHRRPRQALFHSALTVRVGDAAFVIEQAPATRDPAAYGVVAVGPVAASRLGRVRLLRYEVRCWEDGVIPDLGAAVGPSITLTTDPDVAARVVEVSPSVPTLVWGRDPGGLGDMWNSNSVIAWVLTAAGIDVSTLTPPREGRAPGWGVGRVLAERAAPAGLAVTPPRHDGEWVIGVRAR